MATTPNSTAGMEADLPVFGELVVLNGKQRGMRTRLTSPLTLIGQSPGCEIRLHVEGVHPIHCALVHGPAGLMLRDMGSLTGTLVNGEPRDSANLQQGDEIIVGPFHFLVELSPETQTSLDPRALREERDALRIQAAAVVAQQVELTEEELRLQGQRTGLQQQEKQLADRLEERRQRLLQLQEQIRQDRDILKQDRRNAEQEREQLRIGLDARHKEATQSQRQAERERQRLVALRRRLRRRWKRHFRQREEDLARREASLANERNRLDREKELHVQEVLRFNGEVELGRRELREQWQDLGLAHQRWEEGQNQEHAERTRKQRELQERTRAVELAEQQIREEARRQEQLRAVRAEEVQGLENRIRQHRQALQEVQRQLAREEGQLANRATLPDPVEVLSPPQPLLVAQELTLPEGAEALRTMAEELADQRWHLLEQWQALLTAHVAWQYDRAVAVRDLVGLRKELHQRQQRLQHDEHRLDREYAELTRQQAVLVQQRLRLEGQQAQWLTQETHSRQQHSRNLAEIQTREGLLESIIRHLEELYQERLGSLQSERDQFHEARARCEEIRRQYAELWQEYQQRQDALLQQQRELDGEVLALESYRQEWLARSPDSAAAERQLEKMRRRAIQRRLAVDHQLIRDREAVMLEARQVRDRAAQLVEQEDALLRQLEVLASKQVEHAEHQMEIEQLEDRHRLELQRSRSLHEVDQQQLQVLRDEVERLARVLIEEVEPIDQQVPWAA